MNFRIVEYILVLVIPQLTLFLLSLSYSPILLVIRVGHDISHAPTRDNSPCKLNFLCKCFENWIKSEKMIQKVITLCQNGIGNAVLSPKSCQNGIPPQIKNKIFSHSYNTILFNVHIYYLQGDNIMKLWKMVYLLEDDISITQHTDFWWSTTPPTIKTPQHFWNQIFRNNYTVIRILNVSEVSGDSNPNPYMETIKRKV